jgi:septal ring factor EnvC (AmiA/AmiB activator)
MESINSSLSQLQESPSIVESLDLGISDHSRYSPISPQSVHSTFISGLGKDLNQLSSELSQLRATTRILEKSIATTDRALSICLSENLALKKQNQQLITKKEQQIQEFNSAYTRIISEYDKTKVLIKRTKKQSGSRLAELESNLNDNRQKHKEEIIDKKNEVKVIEK